MATYLAHYLSHIDEYRKKRALAAREATRKGGASAASGATPVITPIPTKPEEMTWRDYVIMLLHIGSELEHGLMVQYLYAAYSLGGDHLTGDEQAEVKQWQDLILTVAREEMGHLLTVQNLLCLVGGPITFEREDFPWDTPFYPFPFNFEPLTLKSLAAYVFAEMPGNFDSLNELYAAAEKGSDAEIFKLIGIPYIESTVREWVKKGGARPVGEVYQLIHDILANPEFIPDAEFRAETYPLQASWDDWGRGYRPNPSPPSGGDPKMDPTRANIIIERVATRTEALYALREISGQGEHAELKLPGNEEASHFERFAEVMEKYERKLKKSKTWHPAREVPVNPTTATTSDPNEAPKGCTLITNPASAKWADLFNCRYRILLTCLTHTFRLARVVNPDEPNTRGAIMHRIFGEMYNLKTISGILIRMPLTTNPKDPCRAGPPFQMPYSLVLPPDEIDCWRLHRETISNSQALCNALLDPATDFLASTPPEGEAYLRTLRNLDNNAMTLVETVLGGLRENGGQHS
jgi:rubrerythrin